MLRYERSDPPTDLHDTVEHLWSVRAPGDPATTKREILIPNGRPTLAVRLGEPGARLDPLSGARHPNDTVLFGITTRPFVLEQRGPSWYVGAQLRPWGIAALLPADRLVDTFLPVRDWLGSEASDRLMTVVCERGPDALADFLRDRVTPPRRPTLALLERAVADTGRPVGDLAADLGLSTSALYRLFISHLGVGPKRYAEILRYYRFVGGLLGAGPADSAAVLAALHGYYDQAHAARWFKRFTGVSAGGFRETLDGIARLMHAPT